MLDKMTKLAALLSLFELVPAEKRGAIEQAYDALARAPLEPLDPETASASREAGILIQRYSHLWKAPSASKTPEPPSSCSVNPCSA